MCGGRDAQLAIGPIASCVRLLLIVQINSSDFKPKMLL